LGQEGFRKGSKKLANAFVKSLECWNQPDMKSAGRSAANDIAVGLLLLKKAPSVGTRAPVPAAVGGTYKLLDPLTGDVMYIGRTNNLVRRMGEWARDPVKGLLKFDVDCYSDDALAVRGREQILHDM
jgi:hypothetical protein